MAAADSMVDSSSPSSVADNVEERAADKQQIHDNSYDSGSGSESSSDEEEDFVDAQAGQEEEEIMPDGDSNADLHALLAFSKSRLEKTPQAEPPTSCEEEEEHEDGSEDQQNNNNDNTNLDDCDGEQSNHVEETPLFETAHSEEDNSSSSTTESPNLNESDQDNALEIAKQKLAQAEAKAAADDDTDPAYLLRLAEKKVKEAEEKAKLDEEATSGTVGGGVVKPAVSSTRRSEANSELWALLNYSKMRVETGATPQLGKKATTPTTQKDDISVSSKLSKSSKRSLNSKKSNTSKMSNSNSETKVTMTVDEGGIPTSAERGAPVPDVTGDDNASVDSLENSVEDEDEELRSSRSDGEDESSDEDDDDDDDEEEEMPSFLQDDDGIDPEETKRLYEEAKFKAASILSVSEEKLTDVQMLQAIAIAEEAARSGEEKFSTKRSLFKLSEAKLEDLRSFLDFGENKEKTSTTPSTATRTEETPGWGIGRGRFAKKVGTMFSNFREKCHELDERKLREREGKPTNVELLDAAMVSIKKELDEFESVVRKKTGTHPREE